MSTKVEKAEEALRDFKRRMAEGLPWVHSVHFIRNPGLDLYILAALEGWVEDQKNRLPIVAGTLTEEEIAEIAEQRQGVLW